MGKRFWYEGGSEAFGGDFSGEGPAFKNGRDTDGTPLQGGTATVEYIVSAEEMQRADENT